MQNELISFASFNMNKVSSVYSKIFSVLKKEVDFQYGAFFCKKGKECITQFETGKHIEEKCSTLKMPVKIENSTIGHFVFEKNSNFSKKEKDYIKSKINLFADELKNYEISNIFQSQLSILQKAIIEKNAATKKLTEKNEELIETDKIRSEFLANVSHELRTPLNSIIGFSTALKDEFIGPLNEKQKNYTNKILSSAIHLTGLINDILDMTKIEAGGMKINKKPANPAYIIKEVINIIEPLAFEKEIKIETKFEYEGDFSLDYTKFRQIMYNLIGNAIKFSHKKSKVVISVKKNRENLIIKVKDFGIGIDKENQKKIFEKFVQLDNIYTKAYSSTGLGLTITNEFVKMHNGKIRVKSDLNKGAEFIIEFPK